MDNFKYVILLILMFGFIKNLFGKTETPKESSPQMALGMILLKEVQSMDKNKILNNLKTKWQIQCASSEGDSNSVVLNIDNHIVMIGVISMPIPGDEVTRCAEFAYLWPSAKDEALKHKAHIIISVIPKADNPVKCQTIFTKVATAVLEETDSWGIYIGNQTLLLSKEFYTTCALELKTGSLPLLNWVYLGMRNTGNKNSIYTYGLRSFNKEEMEIIDSQYLMSDLESMMYNVVHYVLDSDVTLNHGETIGISAEQKLKITLSKGKFVEGKTLKIDY